MPSAPAYSASKAAVRYYGEALRPVLAKDGVALSVICPGFIKTPLTDINDFTMPFLMNPKTAAYRIKSGLAKKKARIAFPWQLYWPLYWVSFLPPRFTDWLFARLPDK